MEQVELHPIACKSCRDKKSKCDRELPTCSQCSANGVACHYPTTNKRGIPSGYISLLEHRLLETELVLFELLSTLYSSPTPIEPYRSSEYQREAIAEFNLKQTKNEKIEEWRDMPLATDEQRYDWWEKRCGMMGGVGNGPREANGTVPVPMPMPMPMPSARQQLQDVAQTEPPQSDPHHLIDTGWQPVSVDVSVVTPSVPVIEEAVAAPKGTEEQWRKYF